MEYFWIRIRTGAPAGCDAGGGIHVEKAAQVVSIRPENRIATWLRNLKGKFIKDRTMPQGIPDGLTRKMFPVSLVVELPSTVKWPLTCPRPDGLWIEQVDNIHDAQEAPQI